MKTNPRNVLIQVTQEPRISNTGFQHWNTGYNWNPDETMSKYTTKIYQGVLPLSGCEIQAGITILTVQINEKCCCTKLRTSLNMASSYIHSTYSCTSAMTTYQGLRRRYYDYVPGSRGGLMEGMGTFLIRAFYRQN